MSLFVGASESYDTDAWEAYNLKKENAKLRELAAMLYRCAARCLNDLGPSCLYSDEDGCGMDCMVNGDGCCMRLLEQRVRELGIEASA